MPTITSTPVQIASDPQYRMASTELRPFFFEIGANLYQVLVAAQDLIPTHTIGIFKRATSNVGGNWAQMDTGNQPNPGNQTGAVQAVYNPVRGKIAVLYVSGASAGFTLCEFDVSGGMLNDTWGTPSSQVSASLNSFTFVFCAMSDGTYKVLYTISGHLELIINTAGTWGSSASLLSATLAVYGGESNASNDIYFLTNETSNDVYIRKLDAANTLSARTLIHAGIGFGIVGHKPYLKLWGADSVAVGFPFTNAIVSIGTPLAAPVFTNYTVFTVGANDDVSYVEPVVGRDATTLNVFLVDIDKIASPKVDQVRQSVFDGVSAWAASTLYYDEITNPPPMATTGNNQFIHAMQQIELAAGWASAATMETFVTVPTTADWCTGFFLDPSPPATSLRLIKTVSGGSAVPAMWLLRGLGPTTVSGAGDTGVVPVSPGTYPLSESAGPDGYTASLYSCIKNGGSPVIGNSIAIVADDVVVCTITNMFVPPPFRASCPSPVYVVGTPYSSFVTVTGGVAPYTFALHSGSLPAGLSLNASTGELSGTPSAAGPFTFVIRVTDANAATADTVSCSTGRCPGTRSII